MAERATAGGDRFGNAAQSPSNELTKLFMSEDSASVGKLKAEAFAKLVRRRLGLEIDDTPVSIVFTQLTGKYDGVITIPMLKRLTLAKGREMLNAQEGGGGGGGGGGAPAAVRGLAELVQDLANGPPPVQPLMPPAVASAGYVGPRPKDNRYSCRHEVGSQLTVPRESAAKTAQRRRLLKLIARGRTRVTARKMTERGDF